MRPFSNDHDGSLIGAEALGGRVPTNWMTWAGLAIAAVGWGVLIAAVGLGESLLKTGSLMAVLAARSDIVTLAQAAIATGLGLAVIGALRTGFGTLDRFFASVLSRSAAPRPAPAAAEVEVEEEPEPVVMTPVVPEREPVLVPVRERFAPAMGRGKPKNYVIRADGSVEVETLLGTRVFATLDEARDFIH